MQPTYSSRHQTLHWLTVVCVLALIPLAWVMTNTKEGTSFSDGLYNWHETLGVIVLLLTGYRIIWRMIDKPPPLPISLARWDRALARSTYGLFYLILLWMPVTGYIAASAAGYTLKLFNLIDTPQLIGKNQKLSDLMGFLHVCGQWMVYGLILLHVGGVACHLIWTKTGILGRMLPSHATEPAAESELRK